MRRTVCYGQPLEEEIGFSRACRAGAVIAVTGTAPLNADGSTHAPGDVYAQTRRCLEIVADVLERAGSGLGQVVRTRVLLTDMERWREAARAHGEFFRDVKPACTFAEVRRFIGPDWLVEIEADAVADD